jgi:hypothetical protein
MARVPRLKGFPASVTKTACCILYGYFLEIDGGLKFRGLCGRTD